MSGSLVPRSMAVAALAASAACVAPSARAQSRARRTSADPPVVDPGSLQVGGATVAVVGYVLSAPWALVAAESSAGSTCAPPFAWSLLPLAGPAVVAAAYGAACPSPNYQGPIDAYAVIATGLQVGGLAALLAGVVLARSSASSARVAGRPGPRFALLPWTPSARLGATLTVALP